MTIGQRVHGEGSQSHWFLSCSMKMLLSFTPWKSSFFLTGARTLQSLPSPERLVCRLKGSLPLKGFSVPLLAMFPAPQFWEAVSSSAKYQVGLCGPYSLFNHLSTPATPVPMVLLWVSDQQSPQAFQRESVIIPRNSVTRLRFMDLVPESVSLSQALRSP